MSVVRRPSSVPRYCSTTERTYYTAAIESTTNKLILAKRVAGDYTQLAISSGAYGIPQALPGSKMASAGSDWRTNPKTQIKWGLGYISGRYGDPCGAWSHFLRKNWY